LHAGNSEAQDQESLSRLFAQNGLLAAPGVLGGLVVSQNLTADGNVLIAAGSCVLQPTMTAGASLLVNDTTKTLNIFTANPVGGLARNDIVVFDSLVTAITVIVGTPNATPTDPTVPNTSLALARLRHAASAPNIPTAKIDQLQVPTALRGAPVPVANQAGRDARTPVDGLQVYRLDTHRTEIYNGTSWRGITAAPAAKVQLQTLAIPSGAWTNLTNWLTTPFATGGMAGGSNGVTVPVTGLYAVSGMVSWSGNATGRRGTSVTVNAVTDTYLGSTIPASVATAIRTNTPAGLVSCNAGDVISISNYQDSGVALSITAGEIDVWQIA